MGKVLLDFSVNQLCLAERTMQNPMGHLLYLRASGSVNRLKRTSPKKLQAKLNLTGSGGRAGDRASRAGDAARIRCRRRREHDEIRGVEVRAVQDVENLCAELQLEALMQSGVFQDRKIPRGEARADKRVATRVPIEATQRGRRNERRRIEPLARLSQHDGAFEIWIQKGSHGIARVAVVRRVVA